MRSCGKDVNKVAKSKKDTWEPWKFRRRNFSINSESFDGPEIINIIIAKGSFTVLYNMIFDCCESGCYMLRLDGSRAVTRIWYEAWFIRIFVKLRQPIKCRQVKFINFDIWFSESIDMTQKKFVFRQLSRYICARRIQFLLQNFHVVSFSDSDDVVCCFVGRGKEHICYVIFPFSFSVLSLKD